MSNSHRLPSFKAGPASTASLSHMQRWLLLQPHRSKAWWAMLAPTCQQKGTCTMMVLGARNTDLEWFKWFLSILSLLHYKQIYPNHNIKSVAIFHLLDKQLKPVTTRHGLKMTLVILNPSSQGVGRCSYINLVWFHLSLCIIGAMYSPVAWGPQKRMRDKRASRVSRFIVQQHSRHEWRKLQHYLPLWPRAKNH